MGRAEGSDAVDWGGVEPSTVKRESSTAMDQRLAAIRLVLPQSSRTQRPLTSRRGHEGVVRPRSGMCCPDRRHFRPRRPRSPVWRPRVERWDAVADREMLGTTWPMCPGRLPEILLSLDQPCHASDDSHRHGRPRMRQLIYRAMHQPDDLVVTSDCTDVTSKAPLHTT